MTDTKDQPVMEHPQSRRTPSTDLPWGVQKSIGPTPVDPDVKPGEFVAKTLLLEFMNMAERKIANVLQEPVVRFFFSKSLASVRQPCRVGGRLFL